MLPSSVPHYVYVVGLGASGLSSSLWLNRSKRLFAVWDDDPQNREKAQASGLDVLAPQNALNSESPVDAVLLSPGIPHTYPVAHESVKLAKVLGISVIGDIELFSRAYPHIRTICITGTNGKSTTTALITHMLKHNNISVMMAGNIGVPCFSLPTAHLDKISAQKQNHHIKAPWFVFELSSFQLELCSTFSPDIMVVLNISPDHLDRYKTFSDYVHAKTKILETLSSDAVAFVSTESEATKQIALNAKNLKFFSATDLPFPLVDSPSLQGYHNKENAMAAYSVGRCLGLSDKSILSSFKSFPGLEHRQEIVAKKNGITFVNDSKATNFSAASRALESYSDVYWLVGGCYKGDDIGICFPYFPRIKGIFLYGAAAEYLAGILKDTPLAPPYVVVKSLQEALEEAFNYATHCLTNDSSRQSTILLAPGCSSFDQFKNFQHRGQVFKNLVISITSNEK